MAHDPKQQQIASLFAHNGAVIVIIEGQQYEISCSRNENIQLLVNLPYTFPDEAPVITVSPAGMTHPWIESDVIVNDALTCWSYQSNLGMLVHDICEEFQQRPPSKRINGTEESYGHRPPPPIPTSTATTTTATSTTTIATPPPLPTSNIPHATSLPNSQTLNSEYTAIMNKSPEEIEELLSNETAFDLFFNHLDRVKNLKTVQEELRNGNENLAHKNLSQEDALIKLRSEVQDLNNEYTSLKSMFTEKEKQQQEAFNRFSSSTVLTRLKAGVYESDDLSESVAQSFLEGSLDHDSFVKQFRELRKVYHLRASKLEKIQKDSLLFPS
ncbi:uncharacterized protein BX664DRAFT_342595 [Halteromyces radiatus]|uniref:uncharacterized protein n=1 Tax=Halteromyces radiatus TaxID=101107 RepID=UPI00221F8624|nr:uncharacterized protein BX664DRAFT_342595 [Halteromyces radiatus]KAI8078744.1 hypothetical protein BX664DRAFT_342595 [Halteromyces radiatus]